MFARATAFEANAEKNVGALADPKFAFVFYALFDASDNRINMRSHQNSMSRTFSCFTPINILSTRKYKPDASFVASNDARRALLCSWFQAYKLQSRQ